MTEQKKNSYADALKQAQKTKNTFKANHNQNVPKPNKGFKNTTTVRRSGRGG